MSPPSHPISGIIAWNDPKNIAIFKAPLILTFSIVIPTLNEEKYLPLLLRDLTEQTFTKFEVIVVDGNSDDQTIKEAQKFKNKLTLKTITVKKRQVGFQRNIGAKKTRAPWVIFMDADNRLPNYFLQGAKYQLDKHPEVDLFSFWFDDKNIDTKDKS